MKPIPLPADLPKTAVPALEAVRGTGRAGVELYLVCTDLPGLDAGVYHFGPADFALRRLRRGDYRGKLIRMRPGDRLGHP